jgi:threonine dehydratase
MPFQSSAISSRDIEFISAHAPRAPIRSSPALDLQFGCQVRVIDETIQNSRSFKFRGAILGVRNADSGVVAAGAGNFPIAVGLAAHALAKPALLIVPADAPAFKLDQARRTGASIKLIDRSGLVECAQAEAQARTWSNLHAFESVEMIIGSYTLGLEIAAAVNDACPASDVVIVACGGGGLAAGVALALRSQSIDAEIVVAEPETHRRYAAARETGMPVSIDPSGATICDALRSRRIGAMAFEILERCDARNCSVSDALVREATDLLQQTCGVRAEPSGAVALGAVLGGSIASPGKRLWVIACGGNVP